jgi:hypothetical protein
MNGDPFLPSQTVSNLIALDLWREQIGVTAATVWRWRRRGWLDVCNVAGRLYISRDSIGRFEAAAAAGKFAKFHPTPGRKEEAL